VSMVGLSGIPFTNVFNACATAASAAKVCADGIRLGDYDIGIAIGLDKHPRGAFTEDPALVGMPSWYAENGQYLTTQFFGMKANRYLHDHGISQETLAKVAAKNFRNGALNPNAFRRNPIPEEDILNSAMLNYPLTQYMFCAPDEGAAAVVMCRADIAHRYTSKPVYLRAVEVRTRRYGAYEVNTTFAPVEEDVAPTVYAGARRSKRPVSHRRTSMSSSCRTPTQARRSSTWPSADSAHTASRRNCWPTAPPKSTAPCRSTPTAD
jgi:acetyl-CoA C-acetyltransferase